MKMMVSLSGYLANLVLLPGTLIVRDTTVRRKKRYTSLERTSSSSDSLDLDRATEQVNCRVSTVSTVYFIAISASLYDESIPRISRILSRPRSVSIVHV